MQTKLRNPKFIKHAISFPFIWAMVIPAVLMHGGVFIYQAVAFRLYGIERVRLRDYVVFDREKLAYLSYFDRMNCAYCSYMNGLFAYISEIGHRTEYYWCGVKHHNQPTNPVFAYQDKFAAYGSEQEYCDILVKSGRFKAAKEDK